MPPSLSIVIPSYNRPDLLRACLSRVRQYAPESTDVVVVDDASPQGAAAVVAGEFAGVRTFRLPRRRGFCAAVNAGIQAARHPVVELLNDDTEVTPDWAPAALVHFEDPTVAAVAPLVLRWPGAADDPRIDSAGDRYYLGGIAGKRGHGQSLGPAYLSPCRVFGVSGSSGFYRKEVLLRVGAFPDAFGAYFEDVDLSFRLHWAGYEVVFEPASRVHHRVSSSYGKPRRRLLEQQSRNEERVFWRNLPGRALARALPSHLAVLGAKAWRRWQEGELAPFLCGRLRVLAEIGWLRRHRKYLHKLGPIPNTAAWELDEFFWG